MIVFRMLWRVLLTLVMGTVNVVFFLFCTFWALLTGVLGWNTGIWLVSRMWAYGTFGLLFTRVHIKGKENIPRGQRLILVSNHASLFDILALYLFTPNAVSWLAKNELFRIPFVGWMLAAIGAIPVDRGNARKTRDSLHKSFDSRWEKPWICIFPEGTRSKDGKIQPFKKGFVRVMRSKELDILPVTLNGFRKYKSSTKQLLIDPFVHLEIIIHPLMKYDILKDRKDLEIMKETREVILSEYVE